MAPIPITPPTSKANEPGSGTCCGMNAPLFHEAKPMSNMAPAGTAVCKNHSKVTLFGTQFAAT